jgi:hypothetical protein
MAASYHYAAPHIIRLDASSVVRWRTLTPELAAGVKGDEGSVFFESLWLSTNLVPDLAEARGITRRVLH